MKQRIISEGCYGGDGRGVNPHKMSLITQLSLKANKSMPVVNPKQ